MKAYEVTGCVRCGKPCALVEDEIPEDYLCPWCRSLRSPAVYLLFLRDGRSPHDTLQSATWQEEETKP